MEHIFLTIIEMAAILKISKKRAYRLIANAEIPFTRYHRRVIIRLEDLNNFITKMSSDDLLTNSSSPLELDKSPPTLTIENNKVTIPTQKVIVYVKHTLYCFCPYRSQRR